MKIRMHYGKSGLDINLPDAWDVTVIKKPEMPVLSDPVSTLRDNLNHPVGSLPLKELVKGKRTICIAICDITRPVPNGTLLPVLIEEIMKAGINKDAITLLIATGLHGPNKGEELREVVGDRWVIDNIKVINHFARADKDHLFLGRTGSGIPIKLDRHFIEADVLVVVGLVEPHFMAGYSGGRKVVTPGIAHEDTIRSIHAPFLLEKPCVDNCIIDGNPLNEILIEIVQMVGECYAVNTVIDEGRRISFINFGDIVKSHLEAVAFSRPFFEIPVKERFRVVLTSGAGYPLDKNYYQTVKGMIAPLNILEPGGDLFIVSHCSEGIGSDDFCISQKRLLDMGVDKFMDAIKDKKYAEIDEWETEMLVKAMKVARISLYSTGISDTEKPLTGVHAISELKDLQEALANSVNCLEEKKIAVVPEGPYVIPLYERENLISMTHKEKRLWCIP